MPRVACREDGSDWSNLEPLALILFIYYFILLLFILFYFILLYLNIYLLNEEEEREKTDEKTLVAQVGFEPPTFRSCGQHYVHYTTEAPPIPDVLRVKVKVVTKKGGSSFALTRHLADS